MSKEKVIRIVISVIIVGVLAVMWGTQSDLAYNVAQQRAILLGRYTLDKMIGLLFATPILLWVLWGIWQDNSKKYPEPKDKRLATFKVVSLILSILIAVVFVDVAMRVMKRKVYVKQGLSYHRAENRVHQGVFSDKPEQAFSYPNVLPGYPDVAYVLTTDKRGFRNPVPQEGYDWIVLGDSFAEGSSVSDEQVWTALLAELRGVRVYNLGMSGGSPVTYLDTLEKVGVELKPKAALYMLYEGNDFRDSNFKAHKLEAPKKATAFDTIFKASPLRLLIRDSLGRFLEPVGSGRYANDPDVWDPSHLMYPVAWLPIEVPAGGGYGYAFDIKQVWEYVMTEEAFKETLGYAESRRLLAEARDVCRANGIELVVVYAPDKPHVLMEEVVRQVQPEQLYAFMSVRGKRLPVSSEQLGQRLCEGAEVRERVYKDVCRDEGIAFISLTEVLRQKTLEGCKTYYTYDQHWTPDGHRVVAEFLSEQIKAD